MTFANQIKRLRLSLGMTQDECAAVLRVNRRTLASWEAGDMPLYPTRLGALGILLARAREMAAAVAPNAEIQIQAKEFLDN